MKRPGYTRRDFLKTVGLGAAGIALTGCRPTGDTAGSRPNVIIVLCDDQGYADVGVYGAEGFATPHLDRMAAEGTRFTDFYMAAPVCTPSRAALLTGCYPLRVGLPSVIGPSSNIGINSEEVTLAEALKEQGYATACYGKWHLGHHPEFLPPRHGFDDYFGLPYSNDMWPYHPTAGDRFPPLPLVEGEKTIEYNPDQTNLTTWYTERAVKFIKQNRDRPFFLYLPHSMPHVPLYVSDKFKGKSRQGLYGDVIMEIDWSVGQIMSTLKQLRIDDNTLLIFSSDNGPWLSYGNHAGSARPLREGKHSSFDGGHRVPCIMRWPGRIPANKECRELVTAMDIFPTVVNLAGGQLPANRIDGKDIWSVMAGKPGAKSPHEAYFYYHGMRLKAVRSGKWKLHFPRDYNSMEHGTPGRDGQPGKAVKRRIGLELFDLENDIGERNDVADQYPEVVKRLQLLAERMRADLGDSLTNTTGSNRRLPGQVQQG